MIPPPGDTRGAEAVGALAFSSSPVAGEKTNYPPDQGELGSQGASVCMTMVDPKVSPYENYCWQGMERAIGKLRMRHTPSCWRTADRGIMVPRLEAPEHGTIISGDERIGKNGPLRTTCMQDGGRGWGMVGTSCVVGTPNLWWPASRALLGWQYGAPGRA